MRAILLAFTLTLAALPAWAQTSAPAVTPAPLPPEAQDALKKGVIAAQQQDYLLAIRYFQDARKLAPGDPEIYKDLGLAESKIPGRELRAISWFGAYLAAEPDAPNAAAVKEQIDVLDVKSQSNLARLIKSVEDSALHILEGYSRDQNLPEVANLWAEAGDFATALKLVDVIQAENEYQKSRARIEISRVQLEAADIAGAQETTNLIQPGPIKAMAEEEIAKARTASAPASTTGLPIAASAPIRVAAKAMRVSDWVLRLDDNSPSRYCALNTDPFLDFAGYLKSLPPSDDPHTVFNAQLHTAETIARAQMIIDQILKQQARK